MGMHGFWVNFVHFKEEEEGILHVFRPTMTQKGAKVTQKTGVVLYVNTT